MIRRLVTVVTGHLLFASFTFAGELPKNTTVELQPLAAQVQRLVQALDLLGAPLPAVEKEILRTIEEGANAAGGRETIQNILDKYCLAEVRLLPSNKLEAIAGAAALRVAEQGWRIFLVKVANPEGRRQVELHADSPNALPLYTRSSSKPDPKVTSFAQVGKRFLDLKMFDMQPLLPELSGLELEYRILQVFCRDAGRKEVSLNFNLTKPTRERDKSRQKSVAQSNSLPLLLESAPAVLVRLRVRDHDGKPTTGAFTFRDSQGHIYPSLSRRLAPDLGFHPQIYRADGESVSLQPGGYTVTYTRGPEYRVVERKITVPKSPTHEEEFELRRWIHPAARGWYSGDHHVHAAGCAHYESPTEGVTPEDMIRHIVGEDLDVGCCLSWGPCWYHQKRYFEGKTNSLSTADHLLRYDVEVSGFPSSHCGHICLLRLQKQDYPDTKLIEDWPSWDLPIFRWAKAQGGVVGFAHSGWGLDVGTTRELPNYRIPPMNGIGANEYLVDVAHGMCDFISTVDTPSVWELNIWYHTLNCGYRCRISGETDFPCIYGERVGLGRSYVHLDRALNFDDWAEGIKLGRSYVSDGKSHLIDFAVNGMAVGTHGSEVKLANPGEVKVTAQVAALLDPKPTEEDRRIHATSLNNKPYWDLERARIGTSRKVPVEVIVNGKPVATQEIDADGRLQDVSLSIPIRQSSWVCLRVFPSSHTNPVFVLVGDKPIRASKRSAEWCLKGIEKCWKEKVKGIRKSEQKDARDAYDKASGDYRAILAECAGD